MRKILFIVFLFLPVAVFSQELLWNYNTGLGVWSVAVSSDGHYAVAGTFANTTRARDNIYFFSSEGQLLWSYRADDTVWSVAISDNGKYIAAGSKDNYVYFFNMDGELLWKYKTQDSVWSVAVSADGGYVVAGSYDNNVYFFDKSGRLLWRYGTDDIVLSTSVSADGGYVVAGSYDNNVYFFDKSGRLLWRYRANNVIVDSSISADGGYVVAGSYDNNVYFFDKSGRLLWKFKSGDEVWDVSISKDGSLIAAASKDYNVYFFNSSGDLLGRYRGEYYMSAVSTSFDGNYTIAGSYDTNVYFIRKAFPVPVQLKIPELIVVRTINNSNLLVGDTARVTVELRNIGNGDAYNIVFRESLGEGLEIIGGETYWTGTLAPEVSQTFFYDVKAVANGTFYLPEINVSYYDEEGNMYLATVSALQISVKRPVEVELPPQGPGMWNYDLLTVLGLLFVILVFTVFRFSSKRKKSRVETLKRLKEEVRYKEEKSSQREEDESLYDANLKP